jgi:hypothetical protein
MRLGRQGEVGAPHVATGFASALLRYGHDLQSLIKRRWRGMLLFMP